jgi:hypothetical protein
MGLFILFIAIRLLTNFASWVLPPGYLRIDFVTGIEYTSFLISIKENCKNGQKNYSGI